MRPIHPILHGALALLTCALLPAAFAQDAPPKTPPTKQQLEADFATADKAREATPTATKERSDTAKRAMILANDVAWRTFDEKQFAEAATWFARSADLKKESDAQARAYWENYLAKDVPETEAKLSERIKEFRAKLAAAPDEPAKLDARKGIDALERIRPTLRANALSMLEKVASDASDHESLTKYYQQEIALKRDELKYLNGSGAPNADLQKKRLEIATSLARLADAQSLNGQFDAAEKSLQEALALRNALPPEVAERRLDEGYSAFASFYMLHVGDLAKARNYYQRALEEIQANAAAVQKTRGLDNWTDEIKAKMTPQQLKDHEERLIQDRDLGLATDTLSHCTMLNNLGAVAQESGDLAAATKYYDQSLALVEALPKGGYINIFELARAQIRARVLSDRADLDAQSGQTEKALQELQESFSIRRALGQAEGAAPLLLQMAQMLYDKGDLEAAKAYVIQARQLSASAHRLGAVVSATSFLAILARDAGQLDEAAAHAAEASTLATKTGNFAMVSGVARTLASIRLKQGQLPAARDLISQAATADARTASLSDRIATLGISGDIFVAEGKNDQALEVFAEAVKLLESVRATAASEQAFADVKRNQKPYERIVQLLVKMNRGQEAFDYLNRAKSKKLRDQLPPTLLKSAEAPTQERLDKAAVLEKKIATVDTLLQAEEAKPAGERSEEKVKNLKLVAAASTGEYREVVEDITSANPEWEKSMTVKPLELAETQEAIPPGTVFLQYAPLGEQLYIFVVTSETVKIYTPQVNPADLAKKVQAVRRQITTGESAKIVSKNLCALYDMLIAPIEPELASVETIAFIPNRFLFYLPIGALAKKQADGSVRYLIEDKQIVYLTGADVMRVVRPPRAGKAKEGMVAFGNPTGANLPGAETEVKAIATVFPGTKVLTEAEVTKPAVSTKDLLQKRVVHFATHGILNPAIPRQSYLQLATGGTAEQQRLTVREIWSLPLDKVDLVTLSACETALGDKEPDGGEITTLAEAFASAKVRTVIASLWAVSDESTNETMQEFYRLLAANTPKAEALRQAQIKLLKMPKYNRPLYWAPFVLMGDWR